MRKYLLSAALAAFMTTVAAGSAEANDHWRGGYGHGYWHGGYAYAHPRWHGGPVVVAGVYPGYPYYPAPYYPAVAAPVFAPAPVGVSFGLFLR